MGEARRHEFRQSFILTFAELFLKLGDLGFKLIYSTLNTDSKLKNCLYNPCNSQNNVI